MKKIITALTLLTLAGCISSNYQGNSISTPASKNVINLQAEDDTEYELIIDDPGFETWFITNGKPVGFYSQQYYESKNQRYVIAWNENVTRYAGRRNSPFTSFINYDPTVDYGIALNHKLFYYFKYIENLYRNRFRFSV
ncbi:DUF6146 family protein [Fulvivirgaceae bacterium BMA10]|uniref:DUF6146 family protein n=1 Tax=Splendidivirga corallicola TaxID=3051826 RepID=A0ABT8KM70_9BACT|nr:DUF6146 family protein [Fulvivirgaceae bacterium BMA10]